MLTFVFRQAHALVAVNEVPAGGGVQARGREALVIFLLAVEAVVTWRAEKKACSQTGSIQTQAEPALKEGGGVGIGSMAQTDRVSGLRALGYDWNVAFQEG